MRLVEPQRPTETAEKVSQCPLLALGRLTLLAFALMSEQHKRPPGKPQVFPDGRRLRCSEERKYPPGKRVAFPERHLNGDFFSSLRWPLQFNEPGCSIRENVNPSLRDPV